MSWRWELRGDSEPGAKGRDVAGQGLKIHNDNNNSKAVTTTIIPKIALCIYSMFSSKYIL